MEGGLQRQLVIVQALRIQRDRSPAGATAEEVDGAAFAHHVNGPLPGLRAAYGLDDHIATASLGGKPAHRLHGIVHGADLDRTVSSQAAGGTYLRLTLDHGDDVATRQLGHLHEHQAYWTGADDGHRVSNLQFGFVQTAQHAGQRLDHGGLFEADVLRDGQHVGFYDAPGNANV